MARCTWQYEDGRQKVKSAKSYSLDRISKAMSQRDKTSGYLQVVLDLTDGDTSSIIKMPEHFLKEVKDFIAVISQAISDECATVHVSSVSNVGAIVANLDELVKLAQLLQLGVISIDEFNEAKTIIMRRH